MNGSTIGDSARIIEALEHSHPDPALYPSGPAERAHALELEEFFDEELAPHMRRALFAEVTRDREAFAWAAAPTAGRAVHEGFKGTAPVAGPLLRMRYGINAETTEQGWDKTHAAMDRLESELAGRDYLVGDSFTVADLTAAALFFPLVRPAEAEYQVPDPLPQAFMRRRDALASRPGFQWVQEMYRRHRGESAVVPA